MNADAKAIFEIFVNDEFNGGILVVDDAERGNGTLRKTKETVESFGGTEAHMLYAKFILNGNKVGVLIAVNENKEVAFAFVVTEKKVLSDDAFVENAEGVHLLHSINGGVVYALITDTKLGESFINSGAFVNGGTEICRTRKENKIMFFRKRVFCRDGFIDGIKDSEDGGAASGHH